MQEDGREVHDFERFDDLVEYLDGVDESVVTMFADIWRIAHWHMLVDSENED